MSIIQIIHSPGINKLREEKYVVDIRPNNYLAIHDVPYVDNQCEVRLGILVSDLTLLDDGTPRGHQVFFSGEHPCNNLGQQLTGVGLQDPPLKIDDNLTAHYMISKKINNGYVDYYHKMTTYIEILSRYAKTLDDKATAKTGRVIESEFRESVFRYSDNAPSRAFTLDAFRKLETLGKIAIVGLGGTGSYVLDLVAKTPVREIHLFDRDDFLQHNAFRSPGAASVDDFGKKLKKVDYLHDCYSQMRYNIVPHDVHIEASNVQYLEEMNFVFICVDSNDARIPIIEYLEKQGISFIDVGMDLGLGDEGLSGIAHIKTSVPGMPLQGREKNRMPSGGGNGRDVYGSNIQIADLNSLNATLAVIKWKKLFGFYFDAKKEHYTTYTTSGNMLLNEDKNSA